MPKIISYSITAIAFITLVVGACLLVKEVGAQVDLTPVAELPAYNKTCVDLLESTTWEVDTQAEAFELIKCVKAMRNKDVQITNFTTQNVPLPFNEYIEKEIKWHIQSSNAALNDLNTVKGKIRVDDSKTLLEVKQLKAEKL